MTLIEYSKLLFVIPNPLFIYSLAINTLLAFVQVRFFKNFYTVIYYKD